MKDISFPGTTIRHATRLKSMARVKFESESLLFRKSFKLATRSDSNRVAATRVNKSMGDSNRAFKRDCTVYTGY